MKSSIGILSIFFFIFQIVLVVCETSIVFEIKGNALNRVIFRGEKNITLICHVSTILHADVTISTIEGGIVASNNGNGNCVEYTIPEVTEQITENYTCMATYNEGITDEIVEISTLLSLNMIHTTRAVCFQNGTMPPEEYGKGDTLLLSCYCMNTSLCLWFETLVGSESLDYLPTNLTYQGDDKVLKQIVVSPLTSVNASKGYYCVYGRHTSERCYVSPADVSVKDNFLQTIPISGNLEGCPTMVTPVTSMIQPAMSSASDGGKSAISNQYQGKSEEEITTASNELKSLKDKTKDDFHIYVIIITGVMLSLLIISLVSFGLLLWENEREDETKGERHDRISKEREVKNSEDLDNINESNSTSYAVPNENKR